MERTLSCVSADPVGEQLLPYLPPSRLRPTAGVCERGGRLGSCRLSGMSITLLTPLSIAMQSLH